MTYRLPSTEILIIASFFVDYDIIRKVDLDGSINDI